MPKDIQDLLNQLDAEALEAFLLAEEQYWDDLACGYYDVVDAPEPPEHLWGLTHLAQGVQK